MPIYCLTLRKCTPCKTAKTLQRTVDFYEAYLKRLKVNDPKLELEYHYENVVKKNGSNNVHVHAMIKASKTPHITYKKGYSIKFEKCNTPAAWHTYITKNNMTKKDILTIYEQTTDEDSLVSVDTPDSEREDIEEYPRLV